MTLMVLFLVALCTPLLVLAIKVVVCITVFPLTLLALAVKAAAAWAFKKITNSVRPCKFSA